VYINKFSELQLRQTLFLAVVYNIKSELLILIFVFVLQSLASLQTIFYKQDNNKRTDVQSIYAIDRMQNRMYNVKKRLLICGKKVAEVG